MTNNRANFKPRTESFTRRVLLTAAIVTGIILLLFLLWYAADVLLLIFASILVAVFLAGLSNALSRYTPLSPGWSLAVVIVILIGLIGLGVWLLAPRLAEQTGQMIQSLTEARQQLELYLARYDWAQRLLAQTPPVDELISRQANIFSRVTGVFSSGLGILTNVAVVVAVGFYLASNPGLYQAGVVRLMPLDKRPRTREVLHVLGYTLRWWLIGRLSVMAINGLLTALGLWLLGVPLAFTLGLLTALLNFIPNIGPILAGIPAVLIALTQGQTQALYVLLLYIVVQSLEGFIFTPLVQQYTVSIPAALIISAQVLLGVLFGPLGVVLAVPLTASALVLIKLLYVEDWLGDSMDVPGEQEQGEDGVKDTAEGARQHARQEG
ncbi:MAG: AI-2E family transporter [Anaerolineae bacterium]|nr:AI-2E family transporter [Anaerolineae bacterium]